MRWEMYSAVARVVQKADDARTGSTNSRLPCGRCQRKLERLRYRPQTMREEPLATHVSTADDERGVAQNSCLHSGIRTQAMPAFILNAFLNQ